MAEEEIEHADWIHKLYFQIKEGSIYFNEDRFKIVPIQNFHGYVNDKLVRAQKEEVSLIKALAIALNIENALIERKFFEVFEGDTIELKHVLIDLAVSTKDHLNRVKKALDENR